MSVIVISIKYFCSQLTFLNWLQNHLLHCPFKYLTGIDCPGCGFQRSVLALLRGDLHKSILLYPAAIPLLLFFAYGAADKYFKLDTSKNAVKKTFFVIIGGLVLVSYCLKMYNLFENHKTSV